MTPTIVFLHIPKTAGQTIHTALARAVGPGAVSPIRVHTQADTEGQLPPGYRLYSGHLDWDMLESLPDPRFTFTVLRDPLERIASFYFYLRREAARLSPEELAHPSRTGMRMAMMCDPDEYFFGGDESWKGFVRDHYHSAYCAYLVTRHLRGHSEVADMPVEELVTRAETVARGLGGVYAVDDLTALERDLKQHAGLSVSLAGSYVNSGPEGPGARRWPKLSALIRRPETREGLLEFARADQLLMQRLGLGVLTPA